MSVLHLPADTRRKPARAVLDRGDPINAGLHSLVPMDAGVGGGLRDLTGKHTVTLAGTTPSTTIASVQTDRGAALYFTGAVGEGYLVESFEAYTPPFTVSLWFKLDAWSSATGILWSVVNNSVTNQMHRVYIDNLDKLTVHSLSGGTSGLCSFDITTLSGADTWIHITGVFRTDSLREVYFNGELSASNTTTVNPTGLNEVAWNQNSDSTPSVGIVGSMALGRTWDRALSEAEIRRLYVEPWAGVVPKRTVYYSIPAATTTASRLFIPGDTRRKPTRAVLDRGDPINAGLVFAVPLDEGGGSSARDIARGKVGTVTNPSGTHWVTTSRGRALSLSNAPGTGASGEYVDFGDHDDFSIITGTGSICIWFKTSYTADDHHILGKHGLSGSPYEYKMELGTTGTFSFVSYTSTGAAVVYQNTYAGSYNDGVWHFAVGTVDYNGAGQKLYVDGVWVHTDSTSSGTPSATTAPLTLGESYTGGHHNFNGELEGFRIWNRVLSAAEIRRLYVEPWAGVVPKRSVYYSPSQPAAGGGIVRAYRLSIPIGIGL